VPPLPSDAEAAVSTSNGQSEIKVEDLHSAAAADASEDDDEHANRLRSVYFPVATVLRANNTAAVEVAPAPAGDTVHLWPAVAVELQLLHRRYTDSFAVKYHTAYPMSHSSLLSADPKDVPAALSFDAVRGRIRSTLREQLPLSAAVLVESYLVSRMLYYSFQVDVRSLNVALGMM